MLTLDNLENPFRDFYYISRHYKGIGGCRHFKALVIFRPNYQKPTFSCPISVTTR